MPCSGSRRRPCRGRCGYSNARRAWHPDHGTCGAPRLHADLQACGQKHGRTPIARLMPTCGPVGACYRPGSLVTTGVTKNAAIFDGQGQWAQSVKKQRRKRDAP